MKLQKIINKVSYAGVLDRDRKIFDALLPLDHGTSYNSFFIEGSEKTALIDTVDPSKQGEFFKKIKKIKKIDYIVSNHAEQDHSGVIRDVLKNHPEALVLTSAYCKNMLIDLHHINEQRFKIIAENDEISLGDKTLKFIFTPWSHWPETFSTYLIEDKILFSCDLFGAHLASETLFVKNEEDLFQHAKTYFSEIMMPFREIIKRNIEKIEKLELSMIAPSHGPLYKDPQKIISLYKDWLYLKPKNKVLVPYVSMHGSTKILVNHLEAELKRKKIEVVLVNLETEDMGIMASHLVDSKFLVLGTPTLLGEAHPVITMAANLIRILKPKTEFAAVVGSYGWGGRPVETIEEALGKLKLEYLEPVLVKGLPHEADLEKVSELANKIEEIIKLNN